MGIDLGELERRAALIAGSTAAIEAQGAAVVSRGALNIKNDWRANATASSGAHAPLYPFSISYDITPAGPVVEAEIGPVTQHRQRNQMQGALGNILEFGSATSGGHNDGGQALDLEEPRFLAQVEALALRALGL